MAESNVGQKETSKHIRRFRLRLSIVMIIALAVLGLTRRFWWPVPFQWAARESLAKYENDNALDWLDWATSLAPEDGETAILRARAYRRIGDVNHARAAIRRAHQAKVLQERFEREEWLCQAQLGQLPNADRRVPQLLKAAPDDDEEFREACFRGCILSNRLAEANDILQFWINEWPTHARPYLQRARYWKIQSKADKAIEDLQHAIAIAPSNLEISVELASLLRRRNDFESAIPLFERCLKVPRFSVQAHLEIASCFKAVGEIHRSRTLLERAVEISPQNAHTLCELGRLDLETGHYADAVAKLTKAIKLAPDDDECHFVLAEALVADGKRDDAKPHFEFSQTVQDGLRELERCDNTLKKDPRNVEALVTSGSIQLRGIAPDDGVARLLAALEIEPNNATARRLLSDHFARLGETNPEYRRFADRFRDP